MTYLRHMPERKNVDSKDVNLINARQNQFFPQILYTLSHSVHLPEICCIYYELSSMIQDYYPCANCYFEDKLQFTTIIFGYFFVFLVLTSYKQVL